MSATDRLKSVGSACRFWGRGPPVLGWSPCEGFSLCQPSWASGRFSGRRPRSCCTLRELHAAVPRGPHILSHAPRASCAEECLPVLGTVPFRPEVSPWGLKDTLRTIKSQTAVQVPALCPGERLPFGSLPSVVAGSSRDSETVQGRENTI